LIATAIAIGLAAWILSGLGGALPETPDRAEARTADVMRVTVRTSTASISTRKIIASARTEPDRAIELKAETEGQVIAIGAERGAFVPAGSVIIEIDPRDRQARLAEAEALIRQRELEYEASVNLREQQFMSAAELAGAEALLIAARATRERIRLDIARTRITAPFDALLYDRLVEIGDYVTTGDSIAQLVDADPLIVVGNVNERDIGTLNVGNPGIARILDGPEIEGRVRYLAPVADESTRSFRVELEIPNPERKLRVGTSAELVLGAETMSAHLLTPALLTLADDGTVGVKTVDRSDRVRFLPVVLEGASEGGILVTGLPDEIKIITVGQGFVIDGQMVIPAEEASALTQAQNERPY
jgi:multidrug efflux system membrane fusion protein